MHVERDVRDPVQSMPPDIVLSVLTAFGLTAVLLQLLMWGHRYLPVDHPNERSLHTRPVPRFGGLAILLGSALALASGSVPLSPWLWPVPLLAAISLIDDFVSLPTVPRFAVQIAVAALFAWGLLGATWMLFPVLFGIVWMTNLYNFMDGSDGLAGCMALAGFAGYALLAWQGGDAELTLLCMVVCSAAIAFLLRNLHPASVFMGDTGSIPLGFLAAAIGLIGVQRGLWHGWVPFMMFLVFIADASATLLRRLLRGERVWQAHRTHYYQRLVRMGLGHAGTARLYMAAMTGCAASAVMVQLMDPRFGGLLLVAWSTLFALMGRRIDRRWRAYESTLKEGAQ
jgi:UDP-N-acetylmuramyl pentapeptide phosphotransferase/UDP-N-acetylglucosamine-1-phosphate transferase